MSFQKIKHDINGNPRYVTSWCGYGFKTYIDALIAARTIGGRKFNNKTFGGGIAFQAYDSELKGIAEHLNKLSLKV